MRSDPTLRRYYKLINRKFFNNELPNNVCVRYVTDEDEDDEAGCEQRYYGWVTEGASSRHKYQIVISRAKNPGMVAKLATLCHEAIHVALDLKDDHGRAFSAWHEKLTARGLFRKSAVLDGLTLF